MYVCIYIYMYLPCFPTDLGWFDPTVALQWCIRLVGGLRGLGVERRW